MSDSRNSTGEAPVVLVNMPVSGIERPSIALGLIKTILTDAGIGTSVSYANLWFVEHFGLSVAQTLITCRPEDAVVDWLFGAAAFPDFAPDHARFLAEVRPQTPQLLDAGLTDEKLLSLRRAMPAVGAPIIILTGMFSGIVTPTEAAGLAVLYTFLVGFLVYREIGLGDLVPLIVHSGRTAGSVLLILMVANAATFIFTVDLLPNKTAGLLSHIASSGFATLLLMGIVFLIVGMLMDIVAAALMLIPVMMPAAVLAGVDPLHFVVFMTACLAVGLASPPVGTCLFAAAQVARIPVERLTLATIPFYILNIIVLVAVAAFPEIVLWPARILT